VEGNRVGLARALGFFLAVLTSGIALTPPLSAQAWVPPQGEGSFGLGYGNYYVRDHYLVNGDSTSLPGRVRTNSVLLDVGYGLTDRLAFAAAIPYIYSKYVGKNAHTPAVDNGQYHGTFADYRFELRYNAVRGSTFLTPFVAAVIPSHDYTYFAHSAASKDLHEYQLGFNVGRRLDPFLPDAVFHLRYGFTFAEKVLGVSHNRSNVALESGYFLTPSLTLKGIGLYTRTYGGIDLYAPGSQAQSHLVNSPYWRHHDQLARNNDLSLGGGLSFAVSGTMDVYAACVTSVWGQNGHSVQPGVAVGANWGFSPAQLVRKFWPKGSS
jgi:hypothetical protein